jgi:hypothetical protein
MRFSPNTDESILQTSDSAADASKRKNIRKSNLTGNCQSPSSVNFIVRVGIPHACIRPQNSNIKT